MRFELIPNAYQQPIICDVEMTVHLNLIIHGLLVTPMTRVLMDLILRQDD